MALARFATDCQMPVFTTPDHPNAFPGDHPLAAYHATFAWCPLSEAAAAECDAVLIAGSAPSRFAIDGFMELLRRSALHAPTFDAKLPRFVEGDFDRPNFPARLLLKDLELALEVATEIQLDTHALEGLCQLVRRGLEQGLGDLDYSVIASVVDPAGP